MTPKPIILSFGYTRLLKLIEENIPIFFKISFGEILTTWKSMVLKMSARRLPKHAGNSSNEFLDFLIWDQHLTDDAKWEFEYFRNRETNTKRTPDTENKKHFPLSMPLAYGVQL